jgi:hypothetical protein
MSSLPVSAVYTLRLLLRMRFRSDERTLRLVYGVRGRFADRIAGPATEIVIEGFPRSANSFAVRAFRFAQEPREVRIAHHLHAPAQFQIAARHGIPAICLVRDPVDAIASMVIRSPRTPVGMGLRLYTQFYRRAAEFSDALIVSSFEEVTTDLGAAIERLNARFGQAWKPYRNSPANDEIVFERIRVKNRDVKAGDLSKVAVPTAQRSARSNALHELIGSARYEGLRAEAYGAYEAILPEGQRVRRDSADG